MGYPSSDPVTDLGEDTGRVAGLKDHAHQMRAAHDQHGMDAVQSGPPPDEGGGPLVRCPTVDD